MRHKTLFMLVIVSAIALPLSQAAAIDGWGPRFGLTSDPDQVHVGAHLDAGYVGENVRFMPSGTVGIGDNSTLWAFDFDVAYMFGSIGDSWSPYLGGGPGLFVFDPDGGDSDLNAGLNITGGLEHRMSSGSRFLTELKLGLIDAPDLRWSVGWTFAQ